MKNVSNFYYLGLVILGALARILPHPANFTPTGAIAFFAGSKIQNKKIAFAVPLLILVIADVFIGWHSTIPFVYGSFLVSVALGRLLSTGALARTLGLGLSSLIFFAMTNFGVWAVSGMYPHTTTGLWACFAAALPFFRNELAANFIYGGAFYAIAALIENHFTKPALQSQNA